MGNRREEGGNGMRRMGIEPAKKKERIVKAAREKLFPWLLGKSRQGLFLLCNGVSVDSNLHKPRFETLAFLSASGVPHDFPHDA